MQKNKEISSMHWSIMCRGTFHGCLWWWVQNRRQVALYTIAWVQCVQFCYDRRLVTRHLRGRTPILSSTHLVSVSKKKGYYNEIPNICCELTKYLFFYFLFLNILWILLWILLFILVLYFYPLTKFLFLYIYIFF